MAGFTARGGCDVRSTLCCSVTQGRGYDVSERNDSRLGTPESLGAASFRQQGRGGAESAVVKLEAVPVAGLSDKQT